MEFGNFMGVSFPEVPGACRELFRQTAGYISDIERELVDMSPERHLENVLMTAGYVH
jgi:hypothetical protein